MNTLEAKEVVAYIKRPAVAAGSGGGSDGWVEWKRRDIIFYIHIIIYIYIAGLLGVITYFYYMLRLLSHHPRSLSTLPLASVLSSSLLFLFSSSSSFISTRHSIRNCPLIALPLANHSQLVNTPNAKSFSLVFSQREHIHCTCVVLFLLYLFYTLYVTRRFYILLSSYSFDQVCKKLFFQLHKKISSSSDL